MAKLAAVLVLILCSLSACSSKAGEHDKEVALAVKALKQYWTDVYLDYSTKDLETDGYLEIKNTRVLTVKEWASAELGSEGIKVIVEFVIASDYLGSAPYYYIIPIYNTVAIFEDGRVEVQTDDLIRAYFYRTLSYDLSQIIESISDLGGAHNAVMWLK